MPGKWWRTKPNVFFVFLEVSTDWVAIWGHKVYYKPYKVISEPDLEASGGVREAEKNEEYMSEAGGKLSKKFRRWVSVFSSLLTSNSFVGLHDITLKPANSKSRQKWWGKYIFWAQRKRIRNLAKMTIVLSWTKAKSFVLSLGNAECQRAAHDISSEKAHETHIPKGWCSMWGSSRTVNRLRRENKEPTFSP